MDTDKRRSWAVDHVDYTCLTTLSMPPKLHIHDYSDSSGEESPQTSSRSKRAKLSRVIQKRKSPLKALFGRFKSDTPPVIPEEADTGNSTTDAQLQNPAPLSENKKKRMKILSDLRLKLPSGGSVAKLLKSRKSSSPPSPTRSESQDSGFGDARRLSDVVEDTACYLGKLICSSPVATPTSDYREKSWTLPKLMKRPPSIAGSRSLDDNSASLMADMLMSEVQEKMKYRRMVESLTTPEPAAPSSSTQLIRPLDLDESSENLDACESMEVETDEKSVVLSSPDDSSTSIVEEDDLFVLIDNELVIDKTTHRELVADVDQLKDQLLSLQSYLSDPNCQL